MNKAALRILYKGKRDKLTQEDIEALSLDIANQSLNLPIWHRTYFHIFLPISSKKEVNTEYLLHILQGRDKSIVVPKAEFDSGKMKHILLQENTVLKKSSYGIPEPVDGIEIPANKMEVVFVPLLAYDKKGNRIGYGKGFYDRFLQECNDSCVFVGLSFFEPENTLKNEVQDIPLHFCVTPDKLYHF
ncbi:5-formyltetrahydrofolate cyclo-ligase [Aureisphaera sp. CAU 1614]|uniref:5-formyltetrahydrofolate cyclo-ligase n=1 Tax=Halomarinibacterium sedimenti TaxID=2857106 RepID=A0A9X1JUR0_9FLAO|nr:5-formyltetrahydrofolate cyclo-ligase [Halomarinibacterium sedimenti]MBW2937114.1 5-formyltetrahydrofolate cyclo-ligase [Halomarinibacterium sedimenti]